MWHLCHCWIHFLKMFLRYGVFIRKGWIWSLVTPKSDQFMLACIPETLCWQHGPGGATWKHNDSDKWTTIDHSMLCYQFVILACIQTAHTVFMFNHLLTLTLTLIPPSDKHFAESKPICVHLQAAVPHQRNVASTQSAQMQPKMSFHGSTPATAVARGIMSVQLSLWTQNLRNALMVLLQWHKHPLCTEGCNIQLVRPAEDVFLGAMFNRLTAACPVLHDLL